MKLTVTEDTLLKAFPLQSGELRKLGLNDALHSLKKGSVLELTHYHLDEGGSLSPNDDHYLVNLTAPFPGSEGLRWFIYAPHCQIEGVEKGNNPKDEPAPKPAVKMPERGPEVKIPGISRMVGIYEPVYMGSNFTWAELTKGGKRIPVDSATTERIVSLCKYMDKVREFLGSKPITVTSGYRDPATNRAVGGASRSRHMVGDAIDFFVQGQNPVETFNRLKGYHKKGGLAVGRGFVHLDRRPGGPVRWTYPGGPNVALW